MDATGITGEPQNLLAVIATKELPLPLTVIPGQFDALISKCATICFRSPQYFLLNLNRLPHGAILIGGVNSNIPVSTSNVSAIRLALQGNAFRIGTLTPLQQLNQQFAAAQLSLIGAGGHSSPSASTALRSPLICYGLNFSLVNLSNFFTLTTGSALNDLFEQARLAIRDNRTADMLLIANLFALLNGNDPLGRCGR